MVLITLFSFCSTEEIIPADEIQTGSETKVTHLSRSHFASMLLVWLLSSSDVFGRQNAEQKTSLDNGGQAEAEELPETKVQTASDFNEEFVPGTMCKSALFPKNLSED